MTAYLIEPKIMEEVKEEKILTKKQLDSRRRFKKFYDEKLKGKNVKRECECGRMIAYMHLSEHKRTQIHKKIMEEKNKGIDKEDESNLDIDPKIIPPISPTTNYK